MSTLTAAPDAVAETIAELVSCGSVEMTAHRVEDARALGELLPAGTKVYVNHLPRHSLADTLAALEAVRAAGLEPVPHLAARRVASRAELKAFLERAVQAAGVQKVLLIGGDDPAPRGPWADSVALLADGALAGCGLREVGIAGYPEGHPRIPRAALERALAEKLSLAAAQGLGAYVVTQFSFAPARVVEYCAELAARAPRVPVFVGVAGPTEAATLLRFAHRCGVSASLRALRAQGMGIARLVTHTDPREQLVAVARYCLARAACNVVGAHFFSFGGAAHTAGWMNRLIAAAGGA
ncbi:MAG TPA: methylenetetrahydrofolate reductase [Burkholderiales bacterium]|nr:methylenetetrahydrofolate reductase [Burkholderiales bacterium]